MIVGQARICQRLLHQWQVWELASRVAIIHSIACKPAHKIHLTARNSSTDCPHVVMMSEAERKQPMGGDARRHKLGYGKVK